MKNINDFLESIERKYLRFAAGVDLRLEDNLQDVSGTNDVYDQMCQIHRALPEWNTRDYIALHPIEWRRMLPRGIWDEAVARKALEESKLAYKKAKWQVDDSLELMDIDLRHDFEYTDDITQMNFPAEPKR